MIQHMVWIEFKEEIDAGAIEAHLERLRGLEEAVPSVRGLWAGPNVTERAKGFTHGLLVTVDNLDGLEAYADHPDHVAAASALREDAASIMAMDIDV
ncbi:MAG: Dabb family protein [Phycisphaeraceae bacterium]|nr:Dabb family protein [Phycisphaeraceae bacterium]